MEELCNLCLLNKHCNGNFDYECKETAAFFEAVKYLVMFKRMEEEV